MKKRILFFILGNILLLTALTVGVFAAQPTGEEILAERRQHGCAEGR